MKNIIIYTKDPCPYCVKAKMLLQKKGAKFTEIKVNSEEIKNEMMAKSNGKMTVPQIFIDNFHIGGCDDLYDLESKKELDKILSLL